MPEDSLHALLDRSEIDDVLHGTFYRNDPAPTPRPRKSKKERPEHYEVICISLYKEDLERLDAKVLQLKGSGHRKMTRSGLIRFALDHVDLARLPRAY